MNTPMNDHIPQICSEVDLTCQTCTADSARQLAAVCKGLRGKMIGQLFVQIYPNSACAPMHKHFAVHYLAACAAVATPALPLAPRETEAPLFERREVTFARPSVMAAVA